jgi:SAM-dependent methyltransferase
MDYCLDKGGILKKIGQMDKVTLELGCGPNKQKKNAIGIDVMNLPGVDIVADVNDGLTFLDDCSVDEIYSFHFLEHLSDLGKFMFEANRVLKPNGRMYGTVPHFSNPYFYSDYSHRIHFGLYTFAYFCKDQIFKRKVPSFYNSLSFEIESIEIVFASPFNWRNKLKKLWQLFFNLNKNLQEFYEENICFIIPAYEINFVMRKVK